MAGSPLRPVGGLFNERDLLDATLPEDADFRRGLRSTAANTTAMLEANDALSAQVNGDPNYAAMRDAAVADAQRGAYMAPRVSSLRDVHGVGDAVDFAQGGLPQAVVTTLPSLAGGVVGARLGPLGARLGAAFPAYQMERGEAALNQYMDPTMSQADLATRDRAATAKGAINAVLESAVPASLASTMFRKQTGSMLAHMGREALGEGTTEAAQDIVGQAANNYVDPNQGYNPQSTIDSAALGALGGGALTGVTQAPGHLAGALQTGAGTVGQQAVDMGRGVVDKARQYLPEAVDKFGDMVDGARERVPVPVADMGGKVKDFFTDTAERAKEAHAAGGSPMDIAKAAFSRPEDAAEQVLAPDNDPTLKGATDEETATNIQKRIQDNELRSAAMAEHLLNNPATPDFIKQQILDMGSDYSDPANQRKVAGALLGQTAAAKMVSMADTLIEAGKKYGGKAVAAADDLLQNQAGKIVKPNLMRIGKKEQSDLIETVFNAMTPGAKADPEIRKRLPEITNAIYALAARTGDVTPADMKALAHVHESMQLFTDPEGLAQNVMKHAGLPHDANSFIQRMRGYRSAQEDVKNPDSFLYHSLTPEAKDSITGPELKRVASIVDRYASNDGKASPGIDLALANVFGSADNAKVVLDFYHRKNTAELSSFEDQQDEEDGHDDEAPVREKLNKKGDQQDVEELAASYRQPDPRRPFLRGRDTYALNKRLKESGGEARVVSLDKYAQLSQHETPSYLAKRIRNDLIDRIEKAAQRDTQSVQAKIKLLEEQSELTEDQKAELESLRSRKTEDRTDLPGMREELEKQDNAAMKAKRAGKDPSLARLALYDTVLRPEDGSVASDALVAKFRELLDKLPNETTGTLAERAKKRADKEAIKRTAVGFQMKGRKTPMYLSAEGMVYNSPGRGTNAQRFAESVSSVLARPDVEGLAEGGIKPDTIIMRRKNGNHVLFKDISLPEARKLSDEEREKLRDEKQENDGIAQYQGAQRAVHDAITKNLLQQLYANKNGAVDDRVREAIKTLRTLSQSEGNAPKRAALKLYILNHIDEVFTPPDSEKVSSEVDANNEAEGRYADENEAKLLTAQRRVEVLEDQLQAVASVPTVADTIRARLDRAQDILNTLVDENARTYEADTGLKVGSEKAGRRGSIRSARRIQRQAAAQGRGLPATMQTNDEGAILMKALDKVNAQLAGSGSDDFKARLENERDDLLKRMEAHLDQFNRESEVVGGKESKLAQHDDLRRAVSEAQRSPATRDVENFSKAGAVGGGQPLNAEQRRAALSEIRRIRGDKVKVSFAKDFLGLGEASGRFSMNEDRTNRLIELASNGLNPLSTAWHESLHDFFNTLGGSPEERKIKKDLIDASSAAHVMAKLRELLKDHPEALQQIEHDKEERLAYMYQFWADGAMKIGDTGTNIFAKLAKWLRNAIGILTTDQKAANILQALHEGKLSDPNVVADALRNANVGETAHDKLERWAKPITDAADKLIHTATERMRDTQIPALKELADEFLPETGYEKGGLPFMQARAQEVSKRLNRLSELLGDTTVDERKAALENLQNMQDPGNALERGIASYLKEMRDYMVDRGVMRFDPSKKEWVAMGNVKNYFPRVWDSKAIGRDREGFVKLLAKYVGNDQAEKTVEAIIKGDGSLELEENEHHLGYTPFAGAVQNRVFDFINKNNAAEFAKYQSKDLPHLLTTYTQQAVHRAEYATRFGNSGGRIKYMLLKAAEQGATPEELQMARNATMAMEGTLGHNFNPRLKAAMSALMTYENIILLPLSLFSSLVDPLGVGLRSNSIKEAGKAFMYGMQGIAKAIARGKPDEKEDLARTLGLINNQNMLESMGQVYNSMHMSPFMKKVNDKFFKYNGMELWNQRMRVAAMMAGQRFFVANKNNSRYMTELGLKPSDIYEHKDGTIALTGDQLEAAGAPKSEIPEIEKRLHSAMFKFVDGAVLRPNAAHRPIWGSDPRFQLIFHLKQFTYSFQHTIIQRVREEWRHGNTKAAWIFASYVPFMLGTDMAEATILGKFAMDTTPWDVMHRAVNRSGVTGLWGSFGGDALGDIKRGRLPGTSFLGPSVDHALTLAGGAFGTTPHHKVLLRSVPGGSAFR